ncbi:MAG: hypothetical protein GDA39_10040 [Hyphomonadaceae bacterium]|nr:hypothetical protein [Hyphomonadaceae bacterium]MBC6413173.1 hypothetical protein [Hyphomonadaceae bacterium]
MTPYELLVFFHILLFVFWLGADLGVAICGAQFRNSRDYSVQERMTILKLLVMIDMGPRSAWALMIAGTVSLLAVGGYWAIPVWGVALAWAISLFWLWLVWQIHGAGQTPEAAGLKKMEMVLKWALAAFYLGLGTWSLAMDAPLQPDWLAAKSVIFGLIFAAAIMIDLMFRPVGPLLMTLLSEGSSAATETRLLHTMNRSRFWVRVTYILLVAVAFLGTTQPF